MSRIVFFFTSIFLLTWSTAQATPILYQVDNLTANTWEYTYTINNELPTAIEEFTVYFEPGLYENLLMTGSPNADWDSLAAEPDIDDGFADWLALGLPVNPGETLGGFSVAFDFLGMGTPGSQFFEVIDPTTFSIISSGTTQPLTSDPVTPIPEPSTLMLFGLALALFSLSLVGLFRHTLHNAAGAPPRLLARKRLS